MEIIHPGPSVIALLFTGQDRQTELIVTVWCAISGQRRSRSITQHRTPAEALERLALMYDNAPGLAESIAPSRRQGAESNVRTLLCGCVITTTGSTLRRCSQHPPLSAKPDRS